MQNNNNNNNYSNNDLYFFQIIRNHDLFRQKKNVILLEKLRLHQEFKRNNNNNSSSSNNNNKKNNDNNQFNQIIDFNFNVVMNFFKYTDDFNVFKSYYQEFKDVILFIIENPGLASKKVRRDIIHNIYSVFPEKQGSNSICSNPILISFTTIEIVKYLHDEQLESLHKCHYRHNNEYLLYNISRGAVDHRNRVEMFHYFLDRGYFNDKNCNLNILQKIVAGFSRKPSSSSSSSSISHLPTPINRYELMYGVDIYNIHSMTYSDADNIEYFKLLFCHFVDSPICLLDQYRGDIMCGPPVRITKRVFIKDMTIMAYIFGTGSIDLMEYIFTHLNIKHNDPVKINFVGLIMNSEKEINDNHFKILKYLLDNEYIKDFSTITYKEAAAFGSLEVLEFIKTNFPDITPTSRDISQSKNLDVLQFFRTNFPTLRFERYVGDCMAAKNDLDSVVYLHTAPRVVGFSPSAPNSSLPITQFLLENRTEGFDDSSVAFTDLNVVQYLHEMSFIKPELIRFSVKSMNKAAIDGHLDIVKYLYFNRKEGFEWRVLFKILDNVKMVDFLLNTLDNASGESFFAELPYYRSDFSSDYLIHSLLQLMGDSQILQVYINFIKARKLELKAMGANRFEKINLENVNVATFALFTELLNLYPGCTSVANIKQLFSSAVRGNNFPLVEYIYQHYGDSISPPFTFTLPKDKNQKLLSFLFKQMNHKMIALLNHLNPNFLKYGITQSEFKQFKKNIDLFQSQTNITIPLLYNNNNSHSKKETNQ
ncbi:hypothetical protein CYY_007244 [Polysphondylium violaceum]|uniref:Ankyrin repeat-containing protein n=1 Tax=Polysphondylium violaceum TaxID=133409 RepID=A0A8J4PR26_9MYCE|nr:hypothetical protein CYY_007244 [Polysphondylium violaceum]